MIKIKTTAIFASVLAALFIAPSAFADNGWIGDGDFGGSYTSSNPYGNNAGCGYYDNMYRIDCAGVSWMRYKYVGSNSQRNESLYLYNIANGDNSGRAEISTECAKDNIEGFWHLGVNVQAYSWDSDYFSVVNAYHSDKYNVGGSNWGHWKTMSWGALKDWMKFKTHGSSVGHYLYGENGHHLYSAEKYGSTSTVFENFKVAYKYTTGNDYNGSSFPGGTYAFCYGPGMAKKEAHYAGTSTVSGDNGDRSSYGGAYTITFDHKMKKTGTWTSGFNPGSTYYTTVSGGGASANGTYTRTDADYTSLGLANEKVVVSGTLLPGESKEVCQSLTYDKDVIEEGSSSTRTPSTTTPVCHNVSRKIATFTGRVSGKVGNTQNDGSSPVIVDTATATISFEHKIKREGSQDEAGGTASTYYYTTVSGVDSNNRDTSPKGTARGSSTSKLETTKMSKGAEVTPISYSDESFTVDLLPGETKTFCQTLYFDSIVNISGGSTTNHVTACVKVKRVDATCADGSLYGVDGGKNYGLIRVSKNAGNTWATSSPSTPDGFTRNSHAASVAAWTKPSDKVVFKSEMCEGAELSNQYFNKNIGISYGISASSDAYLQDLSTRSWDNNSLQGYSNVGKGIFAGNSYSATAQSPKTTQYTINGNQAGSSFSQTLTWTDLWMKDGGAIDTAHNLYSQTWDNTATATVYTPYNYTTSLFINANRTYALAGATAGDISLTYKIESRVNPIVNGPDAYATRSKKTKFQIFAFKVNKNVASSSVTLNGNGARYYADNNGTISLGSRCNSLISNSAGVRDCEQVAAITGGGESDRVAGDSSISKNGYSVSIADNEEIGTKVCIVGAIWPADSHNMPADTLAESSSQNGALTEGGNYWHLSEPSCFAVAKKPNFQVRSAGSYSQQNTTAYISKRNDLLFGSWSDFEIVAGGSINGMASGAMLWGASTEPAERACYFSVLSFTNAECNTNNVGHHKVNRLLGSDPENIYRQILTRYTDAEFDGETGGVGESNAYQLKLEGACDYDETRGVYVERGTDGEPSFSCLSNGAYYTKVSRGDAKTEDGERSVITGYDWWGRPKYTTYISQMWTSTDGVHSSNTYVVHVAGTLYINQDFHYGNTSDKEDTVYTSINQIPQIIFIAKDIKISNNVSNIDAWLIAENSIDTCYVNDGGGVSVDSCDSQLTVNGPVITKKLYLNRTYGGNGGIVSNAQPAEIFKLNPMTYIWSYSQAQRYMQAITTYQREMPTRY